MSLLLDKIPERKSLQSDWVQSHKISHNMVNLPGSSIIFKYNIAMFIVYVFLFWNDMHVQFHVESCDTALSTL